MHTPSSFNGRKISGASRRATARSSSHSRERNHRATLAGVIEGGPTRFTTTRWSLVLSAGGLAPSTVSAPAPASAQQGEAREAMAALCRQYWYPVYAFIRRRRGAEDARDLTQKFMLRLIEKGAFAQADPSRGRFRSWLLGALKHFLANEWDYEHAQSRHPARLVSLDEMAAEKRYASEPSSLLTPERLYDRAFSLCVLERAIARLGEELAREGHRARFEVVKRLLPGPELEDAAYAPLAASLGVTPNHFKKLVHDYRARFRASLNAEIADLIHPSEPSAAQAGARREAHAAVAEEREFLARALSASR